jgi:predicted DNA-binding protein (UPF0251 family)
MNSEETLKQRLIHRILAIQNQDTLKQIEQFISSKQENKTYQKVELSKEQLEMLRLAEEDMKYGRLITQEELDKRNLEWLNEL